VVFNLAVFLATNHKDVTVFDLDPQATLSDVVEVRNEEGYMPEIPLSHDVATLTQIGARANAKQFEVLVDVGLADLEAMKEAIRLADRIVIPVAPSQADIWSTQRFRKLVDEVRGGTKAPSLMAFINRADTNPAVRETDEAEEALRMLPGIDELDVRLYQRTAYRRSFSEGLAVFELEPRSKATAEMIALSAKLFPAYFIS
jgi:chromosome partitioning protein